VNGDIAVNLPNASQTLALRVTTSYQHLGGFIDAITLAPDGRRVLSTQADVNTTEASYSRAALLAQLGPNLQVEPSLTVGRLQSDGFGAQDDPPLKRQARRRVPAPEALQDKFALAGLDVRARVMGGGLTSTTSYWLRDPSYSEDGSDFLAQAYLPSFGLPGIYVSNAVKMSGQDRQYAQSLTFRREVSVGEITIGAMAEDFKRHSTLIWTAPDLLLAYPFLSAVAPGGLLYLAQDGFQRRELSTFGEFLTPITPRLQLTVGGRLSSYRTSSALNGQTNGALSDHAFSPSVALDANSASGAHWRVSWRRAVRPGAPNRVVPTAMQPTCAADYAAAGRPLTRQGQIPAYGPDSLDSLEGTYERPLANGTGALAVSAYRSNWHDIQQLYFPSCLVASFQNFGNARIDGADIRVNTKAPGDWTLSLTAAWTEARLTDDVPSLGGRAGDRVQNAPRWTYSVGASRSDELAANWHLDSALTYAYQGSSIRVSPRVNPAALQDGFGRWDASLTLSHDAAWLALRGENLTDEAPRVTNFLSSFGIVASRERAFTLRPRTIWFTVGANF